jgi:anti-anti-sigma regulatory factor
VRILKISLVQGRRRLRLIVEGKLIVPWVAEFTTACKKAIDDLHGRELVIDLRSVTAVSSEGESALVQLMTKNVKFQCGVFMKELLKQLARKSPQESDEGKADRR